MRLLHVVATGQRRGAEMFASDLIRALQDVGDYDQQVALLHGPWPPDVGYEAPVAKMRASGKRLPFLRMDLRNAVEPRGLIGRFRPDVVHAHGGEAFKYCAVGAPVPPDADRVSADRLRAEQHQARRCAGPSTRLCCGDPIRVVAVADAVRKETIETFGVPDRARRDDPARRRSARLVPLRDRATVRAESGSRRRHPWW